MGAVQGLAYRRTLCVCALCVRDFPPTTTYHHPAEGFFFPPPPTQVDRHGHMLVGSVGARVIRVFAQDVAEPTPVTGQVMFAHVSRRSRLMRGAGDAAGGCALLLHRLTG